MIEPLPTPAPLALRLPCGPRTTTRRCLMLGRSRAIRHCHLQGAGLPAQRWRLVRVAPHDPQPLLAQARDRYPEGVAVEYLQAGPGGVASGCSAPDRSCAPTAAAGPSP